MNRRHPTEVAFAPVEDGALTTPGAFERLGAWALVAVVLAIAAYIGPVTELVSQHPFGAPGMRTW